MKSKDFSKERHQKILEYVNSKGRGHVEELAQSFKVTETTIRRDLITLENEGLIYRAHGGALRREQKSVWQITPFQSRMTINEAEKERIATFVSQMILDGESLMIDGGSTTIKVAQELCVKKNLLIVTNSLTIGEQFIQFNQNKVIITGGELLKETNAMIGSTTEDAISKFRTDRAIIGVSGFITDEGCFAAIPQEAVVKSLMLKYSQQKIIVADSSKIGTRAFSFFYSINDIDVLVTDKNIKSSDLAALKKIGLEVFVV
ncbi:MAG: DeoR/GlpR family DNA-binding transcription regulator [Treponema sp.]|jgi:DeoR/GlpR family transcriptional regulator of sugar metabolism|nr:DeoR/GlpR family DNA-binding transcription regulator [Treponema sp.]